MLNSQQITVHWVFAVFLRVQEIAETTHYYVGENIAEIYISTVAVATAEAYILKYIHPAKNK